MYVRVVCVCVCVNTSVVAHTTTALQGPSMKPQYSTLGLKCAAHVVRSTSTFSFLVHLMAGRLSVFRLCICVSSLLHSVIRKHSKQWLRTFGLYYRMHDI